MPDSSRRVAVVADDDIDLRPLLSTTLSRAGFEVEAVADGDAALASIRRLRPDVAVLDVTMPGLAGPEVVALVRADPALDRCRLLLLTGHRDARVEGADDCLTKPFSPRELVSRIQALVG